jgi:serine/threonine-protein kinase
LKVIRAQLASSPELAALFMQEGRVALGLGHPNVCHTLRFGTEHGHPFLAMELVHGVTLRELFSRTRKRGEPMAPTVAAKIVSSVAEALHSAHVARDARGRPLGIVHQDVSPQNVMVAYDGTVKLLDFGVASTSKERAVEPIENSHVTVRGKTAYLSPEQCSGMPVDPRSDVFSLGIVLYELLTSSRLFARAQSLDAMRAIAEEPLPEWPTSIPEPLRRVLDLALAQDRADRYPTAAALQEDLERYLANGRSVVTSARISAELRSLLGNDFGRAPTIDASSEGVAWLRSEAETLAEPIPLVTRRPSRTSGRAIAAAFGVVALSTIAAFAGFAAYAMRTSPDARSTAAHVAPAPAATETATRPELPREPVIAEAGDAPTEQVAAAGEPVIAESEPARVVPRRARGRARRRIETVDATPADFVEDPGF